MIKIYEDLEELKIPVFAEGDAPENLPDQYFTFNEDYTSGNVFADNAEKSIVYEFTLKYYTNDAKTLYSGLINAMHLLRSKGYKTTGVGYANGTYRDTWLSRRADIKKIENL